MRSRALSLCRRCLSRSLRMRASRSARWRSWRSAVIVVRAALFGDPVAGWPSLACIITFIGGLQLLCLGVIEAVSGQRRILRQKRRPVYIVREEGGCPLGAGGSGDAAARCIRSNRLGTRMLIHRIAAQLYTAEGTRALSKRRSTPARTPRSRCRSPGRVLMFARAVRAAPRPVVYIVSGEDAASVPRAARRLCGHRTCRALSPSARTTRGWISSRTMPWWPCAARHSSVWRGGEAVHRRRHRRGRFCGACCRRRRAQLLGERDVLRGGGASRSKTCHSGLVGMGYTRAEEAARHRGSSA